VTAPGFLLLANPAAGAGRARARLAAIERLLRARDVRFETATTDRRGHATELVRDALARGVTGIAVLGGDGTFNEAVNGFFTPEGTRLGEGTWLAPLPAGTGGDFRRAAGLRDDPAGMVEALVAGSVRRVDCGFLSFVDDAGAPRQRAFLNIASFGMGGVVDRVVNGAPKWLGGRATFFLGALQGLRTYTNRPVRVSLDDGPPRETEVVNFAVANGRFFGGGMHVAPHAQLDDGLFDVIGIERMSKREIVALSRTIYRGAHLETRGVTQARARRVFAEPLDPRGAPVLLDVDGEAPGRLPATFEMRAGALLLRT
jgi:diacylglycerol kinase (ATP)